MACFDNIISIKNSCNVATPLSGMYLDDIGINLGFMNGIATDSNISGDDLATEKIDFARRIMVSNIRTHFSDRFIARSLIDGDRIGYIQDNLDIIASDSKYRGLMVELCNNDTYIDFYLSRLDLFLNFTGSVTVRVFDVLQGREIDTIPVTGITAGERKIVYTNKTYQSDRQQLKLFFAYDASSIQAYTVTTGINGCTTCGKGGLIKLNPYLEASAREMELTDTPVDENLDGAGDAAGMSLIYSINCNQEHWMCDKANMLALPLLYKSGEVIMQHAIENYEQLSPQVLVHQDKIIERRDRYQELYLNELSSVLKKMTLPKRNVCFKCNNRVLTTIALP